MELKDIKIKDYKLIDNAVKKYKIDKNDSKLEQSFIDILKLNDLPITETNKIIKKLFESFSADLNDDLSNFVYRDKKHKLIDFGDDIVGRFIDADNYFDEPNLISNFMVAVFKINNEEYNGTVDKKLWFDDLPATYFIYAKNKFINYKETCYSRFKYLYRANDEDNSNTQLNGNIKLGGLSEEEFENEFGWYGKLYIYSKEQYMSIKDVTNKISADEFLYFINFYKRKCELDNERIRNH